MQLLSRPIHGNLSAEFQNHPLTPLLPFPTLLRERVNLRCSTRNALNRPTPLCPSVNGLISTARATRDSALTPYTRAVKSADLITGPLPRKIFFTKVYNKFVRPRPAPNGRNERIEIVYLHNSCALQFPSRIRKPLLRPLARGAGSGHTERGAFLHVSSFPSPTPTLRHSEGFLSQSVAEDVLGDLEPREPRKNRGWDQLRS